MPEKPARKPAVHAGVRRGAETNGVRDYAEGEWLAVPAFETRLLKLRSRAGTCLAAAPTGFSHHEPVEVTTIRVKDQLDVKFVLRGSSAQ